MRHQVVHVSDRRDRWPVTLPGLLDHPLSNLFTNVKDTGGAIGAISSGCFTAIVAPDSTLLCEPIRSGEGIVIADLDFTLIDKRKQLMDSRGHYSRPELLSLLIDRNRNAHVHERDAHPKARAERPAEDVLTAVV